MKYYELNRGGLERLRYPEPQLFGEWEKEVLWKNEWRNRNLTLPVTMSVKNRYNPYDYPLADSALVSQKLLDIIKKLNKDYEALPTQLYYKEKEPIWDTYYSMIFPEYEAFNFEKSDYDTGPYGEGVCMVNKLVLSGEKLSRVDTANNIFVIKETNLDVVCTETAKNMIEAAGIKDIRFTELPVDDIFTEGEKQERETAKMFDDEIAALQADMVYLCRDYSRGVADKIFIIASCEKSLDADCFFVVDEKIFERHKINTSKPNRSFDVSANSQKQMLDELKEDVKKIKAACKKYGKPMFKEMRLTYDAKTKKIDAEYKYEAQLTDGKELPDIVNEWFEEEKSKIGGRSWGVILMVIFIIILALVLMVARGIKSLARKLKRRLRREKKTFEEEFSALQADMVDTCNEYSQGLAEKVFIYVTYENGVLYATHFHIINSKILMPEDLNNSGLGRHFEVESDVQKQVMDILEEDTKKMESLCAKHGKPMFTEMRLTYEVKTKKTESECKYDPQFTDSMALGHILNAWFEEEKTKLAHRENKTRYYEIGRGGEELKYPEPELFGEWAGEGLYANDWRNRNLKLPVTMTVKNKYNPKNYPLADSALVSQKLLDIIKQLNKDYEALPTQLYYKEKEPIWDTYYSMIFPEYEVFNFEKSEYTTGPYGEGVCMVNKLVLSKKRLSYLNMKNNIFALKEASTVILCTETAKDMIEAAGIKDMAFTEVPVE